MDAVAAFCFNDDGTLNSKYFKDYLYKKFNSGNKSGFYGWQGLHYFLYEYELNLLSDSHQKKMGWEDLFKTSKDKISIEHIFPQTPTDNWKVSFANVAEKDYHFYSGSIGNLLLLSMSVNSALQNDGFNNKKAPKYNDAGKKVRNGYSDGSHSEIEASKYDDWNPANIEKRGLRLLEFMEEKWNFSFENDQAKKALLFLNAEEDKKDRELTPINLNNCLLSTLSDGSANYILPDKKDKYEAYISKWRPDCTIIDYESCETINIADNNTSRNSLKYYGFVSAQEKIDAPRESITDKDMTDTINLNQWIFAKTMPDNPHYYALRKQWQGAMAFNHFVQIIRDANIIETFKNIDYNVMQIDDYIYWSMGAPTSITILINRRKA